jgi:hypothetical protein
LDEGEKAAAADGLLDADTRRKRETQPGIAWPVPHLRLLPTLHPRFEALLRRVGIAVVSRRPA